MRKSRINRTRALIEKSVFKLLHYYLTLIRADLEVMTRTDCENSLRLTIFSA